MKHKCIEFTVSSCMDMRGKTNGAQHTVMPATGRFFNFHVYQGCQCEMKYFLVLVSLETVMKYLL